MSDMEGKRITVEEYSGERVVVLHNPGAPDSLKRIEAGRIITMSTGAGFQPAPFLAGLFSPDTLRTIAGLIEEKSWSL